jgi:hypothetical protein
MQCKFCSPICDYPEFEKNLEVVPRVGEKIITLVNGSKDTYELYEIRNITWALHATPPYAKIFIHKLDA